MGHELGFHLIKAKWGNGYAFEAAQSVIWHAFDKLQFPLLRAGHHPDNINYPTFWHARGYGLFAANPLGEKIFTNGKSEKDLRLKKGESVRFYYKIIIHDDKETVPAAQLDKIAEEFAQTNPDR